jgi:MoaA/NifB/PqqE/SkfB family radical SAM enzyme
MTNTTNSVFIHESALFRRKDFTYEDVNAQYPPKWDDQNFTADGILKSFDKVLLRLESTNHCNFKCTFCPHPIMTREKGFMDENMVYRLLEEAGQMGFKMLDLRNFGEPIVDKRIADFAKHGKLNGFETIYIHTNGHLLTKEKLDKWGESGITNAIISLSPKGEFAQTRPGINVDKFFNNLEKLIKDDPLYLDILSVDYIKTGMSTKEQEKEFFDWMTSTGLKKRMSIELHNWAVGEDTSHYRCHRLWSSITVLWNGLVALCCLDYEGDYVLGDMNTQTLKELVNNDLYVQIRKNHANGKFLSKCASCDMPKQKDL